MHARLFATTALAAVVLGLAGALTPAPADPSTEAQPPKQPEKVAASAAPMPFQLRDLRSDPPEVESASVQLLKEPTREGNTVLRVRFVAGQGLPAQLVVGLDERVVL